MAKINHYRSKAQSRALRVRSKLFGTADKPRLSVFRSSKYIAAQVIDDEAQVTLVSMHEKALSAAQKKGSKTERAAAVGKALADKMGKKKITSAVFDRGSYRYHGRVKQLAEAVREAGIRL